MIKLKRVYEQPSKEDGSRMLVERLWPRGISKERARLDMWLKDIAPSPELRTWYSHDQSKWKEFRRRYWVELGKNKDGVRELKRHIKEKGTVTFVYAARDVEHNSSVVLKAFLEQPKKARV